nr:uncharacterized protein LOC109161551 isoform X1 [Ipomoea batatas]
MASMKLSLVLLLALTLSFQAIVFADIICENLPKNVCAFSVSSSTKRCVLENLIKDDGKVKYQCKTSGVVVGNNIAEYIETELCVEACGVDRESIGMSSDSLLDPTFMTKLCSPACYHNCPNIVDLYFNLASGEGVFLPNLCQKQSGSLQLQSDGATTAATPRRGMAEIFGNAVAPVADTATAATPRRGMAEIFSNAVAPVVDTATQQSYPRRAMIESSDRAEAPAPISSDDLLY